MVTLMKINQIYFLGDTFHFPETYATGNNRSTSIKRITCPWTMNWSDLFGDCFIYSWIYAASNNL